MINLALDPKSDEEILAAYEEAITTKTKVLVVNHINNFTGQILPVRKIADMAHQHEVGTFGDYSRFALYLLSDCLLLWAYCFPRGEKHFF